MTSKPIDTGGFGTPPWRSRVTTCLTGILAIAAILTTGYWGWQGVGEEDTEALESPLMMSVARQLVSGPSWLYGPFDGKNPLVLIHAPLYYRLAGLTAWPMFRAGVPPVTAARIAGRSLSFLGLLATLLVAYRLARLGGGSRLAGWWAVLLIASSPVLAGQPFSVRPDMLGVALQSAGLLLVLSAMQGGAGAGWRIVWGYVAFGLAICVKQHLVAEAAVCTASLILIRRGSAVSLATIARGLAVGLAIVLTVYGAESVVTGSRIWDAAFEAAGQVGRIYPGGWGHVRLLQYGLTKRNAGFLVLLPIIGLTMVGFPRGIFRKIVVIAGTSLFGLILVNMIVDTFLHRLDLEVTSFFISLLAGPIFFGCASFARSSLVGNRFDRILWVCVAAELALVFFLAYLSTGSWLNYGIQTVVLIAVLAARAASRVFEASPSSRALWPLAVGIVAILFSSYIQVNDADLVLKNDRSAVAAIFEHLKQPRAAVYFIDRPGLNRLGGRLDMVYDQWLYRVFESAHLAESRSAWLGQALANKEIRAVVSSSENPVIEGIGIDLRAMGFRADAKVGNFYVMIR